jgi:soluble lytic murein transglycosylase
MKKLFCLFLLSASVSAQTLSEKHQKIVAAFDARDYAAAAAELQDLRKTDAKAFEANNYDYLLGRAAERGGDLATATAAFQTNANRNSILKPFSLWHLALLMRASGNLMLERLYLQNLIAISDNKSLNRAAQIRLANSYFESRDYQNAIDELLLALGSAAAASTAVPNATATAANENLFTRDLLKLLGEAYLGAGDAAKAVEIFNKLINEMPKPEAPDDAALAAARGLDESDAKQTAEIGDNEHFERARIYQFNRAFAEAAKHYAAIVERFTESPKRPDALFQLGRIASQEERYEDAIKFFAQVQGDYGDSYQARDALAQEAAVYARAGNADEAISRYKFYISKYIDAGVTLPSNPERPFLNIIDALRDKGRDADALEWCRIVREKFKNQLPAAQALFSQLRIHLSQKNWTASLADIAELEAAPDLGGTRVAGGTDKTEIAFLKGYALEQANRFDEAVTQYLSISDGRSEYYGGRSTARLRQLTANPKAVGAVAAKLAFYRQTADSALQNGDAELARIAAQNAFRLTSDENIKAELLNIVRKCYERLPIYQNVPRGEFVKIGRQEILTAKQNNAKRSSKNPILDELVFLHLYDEAAPEFEKMRQKSSQSPKTDKQLWTLAAMYSRGDFGDRAVQFAEFLWKNVPRDYLIELAPPDSIRLLYPAPYKDSLLRYCVPRAVDARFVLSIMRQESRFRADAKSDAAARGLMQFIPSTAERIARQLNLQNFVPNDLYDPPTAINFGSQYLANIFRQFPNEPQAAAAAYNGGEANVTRWIIRSRGTDEDLYVAEIQFPQSKDYVYKVMSNYRVYKTLYDESLQSQTRDAAAR